MVKRVCPNRSCFLPYRYRQRVLLILLFICVVGVVSAGHRPTGITALMFNDSVTLGLFDNPDDLRSYGMQFSFRHKSGWAVDSSLFGLTFREREGVSGGRYDEFLIQGRRTFDFHFGNMEESKMMLSLSPFVGIMLAGNLGLEKIQNFVHGVLDINELDLPYESGDVRFPPHIGADLSFVYREPAPWFPVSDLVFRAEVGFLHSFSYVSTVTPKISIGHNTERVSDLMIGLGYSWAHSYDDWLSHEIVTTSETGAIAFLSGHFGVLSFTYQWFLEELQGYGGLGFDIGFGDTLSWERSDVVLTMGMVGPGNMTSTSLRYMVFDEFGVFASNMFKMVPLSEDERTREIVSVWLVGGDYEFPRLDVGWMRPYATMAGGITRVLVMEDAVDSVVDSNGRVRAFSEVRFSADALVGVRFFPEGMLQYDGVSYGFEVGLGLMFNDMDDVSMYDGYVLELVEVWRPYVKVGITAGSHL